MRQAPFFTGQGPGISLSYPRRPDRLIEVFFPHADSGYARKQHSLVYQVTWVPPPPSYAKAIS